MSDLVILISDDLSDELIEAVTGINANIWIYPPDDHDSEDALADIKNENCLILLHPDELVENLLSLFEEINSDTTTISVFLCAENEELLEEFDAAFTAICEEEPWKSMFDGEGDNLIVFDGGSSAYPDLTSQLVDLFGEVEDEEDATSEDTDDSVEEESGDEESNAEDGQDTEDEEPDSDEEQEEKTTEQDESEEYKKIKENVEETQKRIEEAASKGTNSTTKEETVEVPKQVFDLVKSSVKDLKKALKLLEDMQT